MAWISAVFFCLGAADTLLGDRLGLGSAFRQGFAAVVDLLLLMTGFMALAPWLGTHLAPVITPVFSAVGCDPSLFASLFLSCDAGGAVLAAQIAQEPSAGLYNGLIVAAFLGSTINGTIPLALGRLTGTKRAAAVRGLFLGFLVLPVGCLLTGALCGIPLSVLLHNTWPVLAVAVLLLLLFKSGSSAIGPIFNGISLAVRGLTLFGFCISVLQETTGIVLLEGLTPLAEIYPVICSIGAFLAGILPFFAFVQRLLTAPLTKLAARLQLEPASITGLVVTSANCIPTLLSLDKIGRATRHHTEHGLCRSSCLQRRRFSGIYPAIQPRTRPADDGRPPFKRLAGSGALPENNTQNHISQHPQRAAKARWGCWCFPISFPVSIHDKGTAEAVPLTVVDLCLMAAALDVFGQFLPQV
mgnify:CR=1 FL=1